MWVGDILTDNLLAWVFQRGILNSIALGTSRGFVLNSFFSSWWETFTPVGQSSCACCELLAVVQPGFWVPPGLVETIPWCHKPHSHHIEIGILVKGHSWEFVPTNRHLGIVKQHLGACFWLFLGVQNYFQVNDDSISWALTICQHCMCVNVLYTSAVL